ncbi:MAG: SUMF1/EgtB/PvdO family nonheme iron enzyme [Myxococcales bacterium]|nr:SUMF1/EgtB/PvdO family nonheme iron enzyme [Myxococcales bacterium]
MRRLVVLAVLAIGPSARAFVPPTVETATGGCPRGMAAIPGGTYKPSTEPKEVTLAPFCMDRTEVTVAAYTQCVKEGRCEEPWKWEGSDPSWKEHSMCNFKHPQGRLDHPLNCVDWNLAKAYCAHLGKRLPTDAEWEWVARGGDAGYQYPWGNSPPVITRMNVCGDECVQNAAKVGLTWKAMFPTESDPWVETAPVGSYPPTRFGLYDIAGNACEWIDGGTDDDRPYRGGCWSAWGFTGVEAVVRDTQKATDLKADLGFRCVK